MFFALFLQQMQGRTTLFDISIGVWTGYECINDRMVAACKTWIRQFPHVNVYSDFFPAGSEEYLQELAKPTMLTFYELGNCAKHLILPDPWEKAQPRFVKAMEHMYRNNTSYKWYAFCDDDSHLFANTLLSIAQRYSSKDCHVLGHYYCAWPEVVFDNPDEAGCLDFAQGGAGVLISNAWFAKIADYLTDCNKKYNKRLYAGSMRFAKCASDHFPGEWVRGRVCTSLESNFYSSGPIVELLSAVVTGPPANFHKMTPSQVIQCHYGIRSDWFMGNGTNVYVDWVDFCTNPYEIYYGPGDQQLVYRFGYGIAANTGVGGVFGTCSSPLVPHFAESDTNREKPIYFVQEFMDTAKIILISDDSIEPGTVEFDHSEDSDTLAIYIRACCPEIHEYRWDRN